MKPKYAILLFSLILSGCSTPYTKSNGIKNGYSEKILEPNLYQVRFEGNVITSPEKAKDFALFRATEITIENNCPYFSIVHSENPPEVLNNPNILYMNQINNSPIRDGSLGNYHKPVSTITIRCFKKKPSTLIEIFHAPQLFYAPELQESLKQKYSL